MAPQIERSQTQELRRPCPLLADRVQEGDKPSLGRPSKVLVQYLCRKHNLNPARLLTVVSLSVSVDDLSSGAAAPAPAGSRVYEPRACRRSPVHSAEARAAYPTRRRAVR